MPIANKTMALERKKKDLEEKLMRIERAIGWRYGQILVGDLTEKEIKDALKDRDDWDRVCVSDKFEFIDQKLQDSFQDDLFFPDDMLEKEVL